MGNFSASLLFTRSCTVIDSHLFPILRSHLGSQDFKTDKEVQNAVNGWSQNQDEEFHAAGLRRLAQQYQKYGVKEDPMLKSEVVLFKRTTFLTFFYPSFNHLWS